MPKLGATHDLREGARGAQISRALIIISWFIVAILLATRATRHGVSGDFEIFWFGAEAAAAREPLYQGDAPWHGGYLYAPIFAVLFQPLLWLPIEWAQRVWTAASVAALLASSALLGRAISRWRDHRVPSSLGLLALLVLAVPTASNFRWNNSNSFMMLLVTLAFASHVARRPAWTGLALSLATAIKLTPIVFIGWIALRRDLRTLVAFGAGSILWLALIPSVALGPEYTLRESGDWLMAIVWPAGRSPVLDDANGSLPRVIERLGELGGLGVLGAGEHLNRVESEKAAPDSAARTGARAAGGAAMLRGFATLLAVALLALTAMAALREPGLGVLTFCATAAAMLLAAPAARSAHFMQIYPLVGVLLACAAGGARPRALLARRGLIAGISSMLMLFACARLFGVSSKEFFPVTALALLLWGTAVLLVLREPRHPIRQSEVAPRPSHDQTGPAEARTQDPSRGGP